MKYTHACKSNEIPYKENTTVLKSHTTKNVSEKSKLNLKLKLK
jgi:hypothetical protein